MFLVAIDSENRICTGLKSEVLEALQEWGAEVAQVVYEGTEWTEADRAEREAWAEDQGRTTHLCAR